MVAWASAPGRALVRVAEVVRAPRGVADEEAVSQLCRRTPYPSCRPHRIHHAVHRIVVQARPAGALIGSDSGARGSCWPQCRSGLSITSCRALSIIEGLVVNDIISY